MIAGSWLIASVCIERMMQMSSAIVAVCGKSSLSQAPLWPCRANLKIDGATGKLFWPEVIVVIRWPIRTESGSSMPRLVRERRLVIEQVQLRRGARLEQVDHPLDLGREVRQAGQAAAGGPGHLAMPPGDVSAAAALTSRSSSEPRAIAPRLDPRACRKSRRLTCCAS